MVFTLTVYYDIPLVLIVDYKKLKAPSIGHFDSLSLERVAFIILSIFQPFRYGYNNGSTTNWVGGCFRSPISCNYVFKCVNREKVIMIKKMRDGPLGHSKHLAPTTMHKFFFTIRFLRLRRYMILGLLDGSNRPVTGRWRFLILETNFRRYLRGNR